MGAGRVPAQELWHVSFLQQSFLQSPRIQALQNPCLDQMGKPRLWHNISCLLWTNGQLSSFGGTFGGMFCVAPLSSPEGCTPAACFLGDTRGRCHPTANFAQHDPGEVVPMDLLGRWKILPATSHHSHLSAQVEGSFWSAASPSISPQSSASFKIQSLPSANPCEPKQSHHSSILAKVFKISKYFKGIYEDWILFFVMT